VAHHLFEPAAGDDLDVVVEQAEHVAPRLPHRKLLIAEKLNGAS